MLRNVSDDVKEHYYDARFHGVDWDARVARAREQIDKATSLNMALSHVAALLDSLDDSHTFFVTPGRPYRHDYGWRAQAIGDRCFITQVRPGSDAEAKGLKPGDELLAVNGFRAARDTLGKIGYVFNVLRPQPGLRLNLVDLSGTERQVDVLAHIEPIVGGGPRGTENFWDLIRDLQNESRLTRTTLASAGRDVAIVRVRLSELSVGQVDRLMEKAGAYKTMVLDLRGNPGGDVEMLKAMAASLLGKDVKIGDEIARDKTEPMVAEAAGRNPFAGKLVVLVDSESASSSEVLARLVQLHGRGVVIGDRTSGSVMGAQFFGHSIGAGTVVAFGASVTRADLVMADGKSLEHRGVVPDEVMLPTPADLAQGRDPVLAHAVALVGGRITPEAAGKLFPYEWPAR